MLLALNLVVLNIIYPEIWSLHPTFGSHYFSFKQSLHENHQCFMFLYYITQALSTAWSINLFMMLIDKIIKGAYDMLE